MSVTPRHLGDLITTIARECEIDHDDLIATVAEYTHSRPSLAQKYLSGAVLPPGHVLRSLLAAFQLRRDEVIAVVDPSQLVSALWCPALGEKLASTRIESGLSLEEVAAAGRVSTGTLQRWERSSVTPRAARLADVLGALKLNAADLLDLGDWPPTPFAGGDLPTFAVWLRQQRARLNLSQGAVGAGLKLAQGTYSAWETGRTFPMQCTWEVLSGRFADLGMHASVQQIQLMQPAEPAVDAKDTTPLGALLSTTRVARSMSRDAVAIMSGFRAYTVRQWEDGQIVPRPKALARLMSVLELDVDTVTDALRQTRFPHRSDRGAWICARIHALGWLDCEGASRIGVHRNELSFWGTGKQNVPNAMLAPIARALRTKVTFLTDLPAEPNTLHARRGAAIRAARVRIGATQEDLAAKFGVSQGGWSAYERGITCPPAEVLIELLALSTAA